MWTFLIFIILLYIFIFTAHENRDRLTFGRNDKICSDILHHPYKDIFMTLKCGVITQGWYLQGPKFASEQLSPCIIILPLGTEKRNRVQLIDSLFDVFPEAQIYIIDWVGYGSTRALTPSHQYAYEVLDGLYKMTDRHKNRLWVGHCIGTLFFLKHAARRKWLSREKDRVLLINSLLSYYITGVAFPNCLKWIPRIMPYLIPRNTKLELDASCELKQLVDKIRVRCIHTTGNRHVCIDNGERIAEIIGHGNFLAVTQKGHKKLDVQNKTVRNFIREFGFSEGS